MTAVAILGATGTIGSQIARKLTAAGESLLLVGRNAEKLGPLGRELNQPVFECDFSSSQAVEDALRKHQEIFGNYRAIVNCIGSLLLKPAHATTDEEFRRVLETNLFTAFAAVRAGGKLMRESGGSILLFASAAAEIGIQNHEAIAAAKGGIISLARSAAATYAPFNIRVNVISPGLIQTELTRSIWNNPTAAETSIRLHPLGRLGTAAHVASLSAWLLEPENDWVTGQVFGLDGGLGHVLPQRRVS